MPAQRMSKEKVLELLEIGPARIGAATSAMTDHQLQTRPAPEEWSANEVLAHLRACSDVWGGCARKIFAEDDPTFRAVNPMTWIRSTNYYDLQFAASFHSFAQQRVELLEFLTSLQDDEWTRTATVTGAGKPLTRTLFYYAESIAIHERAHVKQIERIVKGLELEVSTGDSLDHAKQALDRA